MDVTVKRGADVGGDHHLVMATVKVKARKNDSGKVRNSGLTKIKLIQRP